MAQMRCPYHDVVFETEHDQTKPGTRAKNPDDNMKNTGAHIHPRFKMDDGGYISGHPDCPLCQRAVDRDDDPRLMEPDEVKRAAPQADENYVVPPPRVNKPAQQPPQRAMGRRVPLNQ
jgi:hypothetical protein